MAVLYITHNLGVVAEICEDVAVMYLGKVVEQAPVRPLFHAARHPYTLGLLGSLPSILGPRKAKLTPIRGVVPDLGRLGDGCVFADRCPLASEVCRAREPSLERVGEGHVVACWKHGEVRR